MSNDITAASGRFLLRCDPRLHARLRRAARAEGVSLNEYCARRLAGSGSELPGGLQALVSRALELHGADLVALAVFGSWARGEARTGSDVDLLVVLEDTAPIERGAYRAWDEDPPMLDGFRVEPHLVHLPREGGSSGLWAEVALDGIVLLDRQLRLSRALGAVRREIAVGAMKWRQAGGASYWVREG